MKNITKEIPKSYRDDINRAIKILKEAGCTKVYLLGSIVEGNMGEASDIDLAIRGCSPNGFFHLLGKLMLELKHPVDLINLDRDDDFSRYLQKGDILVNVY